MILLQNRYNERNSFNSSVSNNIWQIIIIKKLFKYFLQFYDFGQNILSDVGSKRNVQSSEQSMDEFKPFNRLPQINKCQPDFQAENFSFDSIEIKSMSFRFQNISSKKQIQKNISQFLRMKNIINQFKGKILDKMKMNELIKQLNYFQVEKYIEAQNISQKQSLSKLILNSNNKILIVFDQLLLLLIMTLLVLIPFYWTFQWKESYLITYIILFSNSVLTFDAIMKLNTSYIEKGQIIEDRGTILNKRIYSLILLDLPFILSLNFLIYKSSLIIIFLFFLMGFIKFNKYFDHLIDIFNFPMVYLEIIGLIKLLITILFISHFIPCIWHFIGCYTIEIYNISWITQKNLQNESEYTQYIYSFYWAIVTMITVGYGDIIPQNTDEIISCTLIMLLSCGVYAFSLNKIGQVIQNLSDLQSEKKGTMRAISLFMKNHQISQNLQERVRNYIEYLLDLQTQQNKIDVQSIIDSLTGDLKTEIMLGIFQNLSKRCKILQENFTQDTLKKFSSVLKLHIFSPGDTIYNNGDQYDCSLYFVDSGSVVEIEPKSKTKINYLSQGQSFGENSFFTSQPQLYQSISLTFSKIYKIKRDDVIKILNFEELEKFKEIEQSFNLHLAVKGQECIICKQNSHSVQNCHYFNYVPNNEKIILNYRLIKQTRLKFRGRNKIKFSCLANLEKIIKSQNDFLLQFEESLTIKNLNSEYSHDQLKVSKISRPTITALNLKFENQKPTIVHSNQLLPDFERNESLQVTNYEEAIQQNHDNLKFAHNLQEQANQTKMISDLNITRNNQKSEIKMEFLFYDDFDKIKAFSNFFPHNNYQQVIQNYNQVCKILRKSNRFNQSKYFLFPILRVQIKNQIIQKNK